MDRMETDWISMDEGTGVYQMDFVVPKGAKYFLVVVGIKEEEEE